jgi:hypothetical protein
LNKARFICAKWRPWNIIVIIIYFGATIDTIF